MLLEDIMFIELAIWNVFVGDMLVCEQESQIMAMVLI